MYLALARKYRPQRFQDLIGQPHVTKTLQNAIEMDKLYPTLIFSGMKGVGKTSAARILSKALNCEKGPAIEPCNECSFCKEITEDKSTDYIEIDGASNNGVEEVRNLKEKIRYKPLKNKYRVVVIDEVHMLSNSAWNALLKTVEEPPDSTYFIMATTDFHKIPGTIVSRCQHFEFKRIPYEVIITVLRDICKKEEVKISDYGLYLVAKSADGSLRDAKKILDQAIAISSGDVQDKDVIAILGVIEEEIFIAITRNIFTRNQKEIIEIINDLCERGMDLRFFYNEYMKFFRDLIVLKSLEEAGNLHNLNPENIPVIKEILIDVREVELIRYFNALKDIEQTMKNTENPRIILEYLFLKLSYFPALVSIEELIAKMKSSPSSTTLPRVEAPVRDFKKEPVTQERESKSPPVVQGEGDFNNNLMEKLRNEKPRMAAAMSSAEIDLQGDTLKITFPRDLSQPHDTIKNNSQSIKGIVESILSREINIDVVLSRDVSEEKARTDEIKNDKKINNLAETIKGKIVSIDNIKGE